MSKTRIRSHRRGGKTRLTAEQIKKIKSDKKKGGASSYYPREAKEVRGIGPLTKKLGVELAGGEYGLFSEVVPMDATDYGAILPNAGTVQPISAYVQTAMGLPLTGSATRRVFFKSLLGLMMLAFNRPITDEQTNTIEDSLNEIGECYGWDGNEAVPIAMLLNQLGISAKDQVTYLELFGNLLTWMNIPVDQLVPGAFAVRCYIFPTKMGKRDQARKSKELFLTEELAQQICAGAAWVKPQHAFRVVILRHDGDTRFVFNRFSSRRIISAYDRPGSLVRHDTCSRVSGIIIKTLRNPSIKVVATSKFNTIPFETALEEVAAADNRLTAQLFWTKAVAVANGHQDVSVAMDRMAGQVSDLVNQHVKLVNQDHNPECDKWIEFDPTVAQMVGAGTDLETSESQYQQQTPGFAQRS